MSHNKSGSAKEGKRKLSKKEKKELKKKEKEENEEEFLIVGDGEGSHFLSPLFSLIISAGVPKRLVYAPAVKPEQQETMDQLKECTSYLDNQLFSRQGLTRLLIPQMSISNGFVILLCCTDTLEHVLRTSSKVHFQ